MEVCNCTVLADGSKCVHGSYKLPKPMTVTEYSTWHAVAERLDAHRAWRDGLWWGFGITNAVWIVGTTLAALTGHLK